MWRVVPNWRRNWKLSTYRRTVLTACGRRAFSRHLQLAHACEQLKTVWRCGVVAVVFGTCPYIILSLSLAREDFRLRPPALVWVECVPSPWAPTTGRRGAAHTFLFDGRLFVRDRKNATTFTPLVTVSLAHVCNTSKVPSLSGKLNCFLVFATN